jgi:hypothetical protein
MKFFKLLGDGVLETINIYEFLELNNSAIVGDDDVTIFGFMDDIDNAITFFQGRKDIMFRLDVLDGIVASLKTLVPEETKEEGKQ